LASLSQRINSRFVRELAAEVGFQLAGVSRADIVPDFDRFRGWVDRGLAGEMGYLTDHRADRRSTLDHLLPGVKSVIAVGRLCNEPRDGWMARYSEGEDYHVSMRRDLERLGARLAEYAPHEWRACVDTAPILERSLAKQSGLGWIGKNTCIINQKLGSFFLLGELLTTLDLESDPVLDAPPPDRCGTCTRCIDACPTVAIVPSPDGRFELDARRCISYFTIELRGSIPEEHRAPTGGHVFGCDICQAVCPWNRHQTASDQPAPLAELADLTAQEFRARFRGTALSRMKYSGFLRNIAVAMGNAGDEQFREPLNRMAASEDSMVAEHARWALGRLDALKLLSND
jgi:epoxyqueuosine reductase